MVSIRGGHACSKRSPHGTVIRYAHRAVHKPTSVFRQAIASQIGIAPVRARTLARERQGEEPRTSPRVARRRHTPRSKEPRLRRPAGSSAAEAAASAHERCMDAPHRCLFRPTPAKTLDSLVALAAERFTLQLGIVAAAEPTRADDIQAATKR